MIFLKPLKLRQKKVLFTPVFRRGMNINLTLYIYTGCPNKHGNSVTNSMSSFLWISIVIPNFKSHNIIMSARVYFMKTVTGCKNVSIMSLQDDQWRRTSLLCLYTVIFLYNRICTMQSKHKQTNCKHFSFLGTYHFTKSKNS